MINNEIIYFFIYCFVGWICEEIYCSIGEKKIVYRGFLYGPYLPIYGFGAMSVLYLLNPFIDNVVILFFAAIIITSAIEYFGSFFLEKAFKIKLWDYSEHFMNINGRVCLLNSTMFGILSMAVVYLIQPVMIKLVNIIPEVGRYYFAMIIVLVMGFDFAISSAKMISFNRALQEFRDRSEEVKEKIKAYTADIETPEEFVQQFREKWIDEKEAIQARIAKRNSRIFSAFPSMTTRNQFIDTQISKVKLDFYALREKGKAQMKELEKRRKNYRNK